MPPAPPPLAPRRARRFSDVIADAKGKGFTEPDPRDDLSGTDVARKVTILARQCGAAHSAPTPPPPAPLLFERGG